MKRLAPILIALLALSGAGSAMASESQYAKAGILSVHRYIDDSGQIYTLTISERNGDKGAVWFSGDAGYGIDVCNSGPYICLGNEFAVPKNLQSRIIKASHEKDYKQAEIDTEWKFKGLYFYVEPLIGLPPIKYRWTRHIGLLGNKITVYLIVSWKKPMTLGVIGFASQVSRFLWSPQRGLVMISRKQADLKIGDKRHPMIYPSFYDRVLMSACGFGAPPSCSSDEK
ncbi:MAG: hypothetical protein ACRETC_01420 [Gammaproteobacteria bacterium]